jgi:DNA-binding MarR family transcriptional regulator
MKSEPNSNAPFELSNHLPYLFKHIHSQLEVASSGQLAQFGVNVAVWRILAVLWTHDDVTHRELADLTSIEVSTLSRLSKTVQRDGLIRRKRTKEDQRTVRVTLTEKGRELAQAIIPSAVKSQDEMFANLSSKDVQMLIGLLHKVVENLNRYTEADLDIGRDLVLEGVPRVKRVAVAAPRKRAIK